MEEFIRTITEQIRYVKVREGVARELSDHISDQAQAYEAAGEAPQKALERAVREMGDPVEIGVALDRVHRPQAEWKLLLMTFAFNILGFVILCVTGQLSDQSAGRQCFFTLMGLCVMTGIYFTDYSIIGKYGLVIYLLWTAAFVLYGIAGQEVNGRVQGLSVTAYIYAPAYAGVLYRFRGKGYAALIKGIVLLLATAMIVTVFSHSIPAAINLYFTGVVMLGIAVWSGWFRVGRKRALALLAAVLVTGPALVVCYYFRFGAAYQAMRLRAFLNPAAHATEAGYLYGVIREGLANARLIGGMSVDGTFAGSWEVISETITFLPLQLIGSYGLLAGYALIAAAVLFLARSVRITCHQKNQLGRMVAAACVLIFFVNCCEGLLVNMGAYPITSVAIPFLSRGWAATWTYAVLAGLLLSISRHEKVVSDSLPQGTLAGK